MAMDLDPNGPEIRLSRFLYVGKEYLDYQPGNWFIYNYFLVKNVPSIEELAENPKKQLVPVEIITKAFESNLVPNPEALVFALAVCCRQMKSESLRHQAYAAVNKVCASPQHFILFIKFASQISKQKELNVDGNSTNGWGQGLRKAVNNWYLSKTPMELAKCVTRCRGRYGWKHKDIIKLSHPVPNNFEGEELIFTYIMYGLDKSEKMHGHNKCRYREIIEYIRIVEHFKHCTDDIEAANLMEIHELTLDHVPGHLLNSKLIWCTLVPLMNLNLLLTNLQRIHNLNFLKPNTLSTDIIINQIVNEEKIVQDQVHPAFVLVTIKNYENSGKSLGYEKRKVKEQFRKVLSHLSKPIPSIVDALYKMLHISLHHIQPTGLRYMVTINMNEVMIETNTWRSGNVYGAEAGCIIALALLCSEKNVTVATFGNSGINIVTIDKNASFRQAFMRLSETPVGNVNLGEPMSWATRQNNEYDVFINVVDRIFKKSDNSQEALQAYKLKMQLPHTKLINCAVCSSSTTYEEKRDNNILTINGFDASVPVVIEAFAKSLF